MLDPSDAPAALQTWKVIGGQGLGGIIVRIGQDLASAKSNARLATGALVQQLELRGDRLHYQLLTGDGPASGWVSIFNRGKSLLTRIGERSDHIEESLRTAISWLSKADALLIGSGADMSADTESAIAAHRSQHWPRAYRLCQNADMAFDPKVFQKRSRVAWGFWLHCCNTYREKTPHKGYSIVRSWARHWPLGSFSVTSNVDGHWAASGWPKEGLLEICGTLGRLRCCVPCCDETWPVPEDLPLTVDPSTGHAAGELPVCPRCKGLAMPCVRAPDAGSGGDMAGVSSRQRESFSAWCDSVTRAISGEPADDQSISVVCLELGCGHGAVVHEAMEATFGSHGKVIRVGPRDEDAEQAAPDRNRLVSLQVGSLEALHRMRQLAGVLKWAMFLVLDSENNGAEVIAPTDACAGHVFRKALASLRDSDGDELECEHRLRFVAENVHVGSLRWELCATDPVPAPFFFAQTTEKSHGLMITRIKVSGIRFGTRNAALTERVNEVANIIYDLEQEFKSNWYQERLVTVDGNRNEMQQLIREVHLHVLPIHGFPLAGASPGRQHVLVVEMAAFVNSGSLTPGMEAAKENLNVVSGLDRMPPAGKRSSAEPAAHPTTVVLIRHGEREDYTALRHGQGAKWVSRTARPWDPSLSSVGRVQVQAAARHMRYELGARHLPEPTRIYTSPHARCVESGMAVAQEFGAQRVLVEEGLIESVCEAWMRQWAVPGADATWGGPAHAAMSEAATHRYETTLQGPPVEGAALRPEAAQGMGALIQSPGELAAQGGSAPPVQVDRDHETLVSMRGKPYRWDNFEPKPDVVERVVATVRTRMAENPGATLVFVSHGGPIMFALEELVKQPVKAGVGGMASLSILVSTSKGDGKLEAIVYNESRHSPSEWKHPAI